MQREIEDLEAEIVGDTGLVHSRPACRAQFHRFGGGRDGTRRNAMTGRAVIAGEHRHQRPRHHRRRATGPSGEPGGNILDSTERMRRLGRLGEQCLHPRPGGGVGGRQLVEQVAEIVEGQGAGHGIGGHP